MRLWTMLFAALSLIGCSDLKKEDAKPFSLQEPQIVTASGAYRLNDQRVVDDLVVDEGDRLSIPSPSQSFRLQAITRCETKDARRFPDHEIERRNPREIGFLEMLPIAAIREGVKAELRCQIDFSAQNDEGSTHTFKLNAIKVQVSQAPKLPISLLGKRYITYADRKSHHVEAESGFFYRIDCGRYSSEKLITKADSVSLEDLTSSLQHSSLMKENLDCMAFQLHAGHGIVSYSKAFSIVPDTAAVINVRPIAESLELESHKNAMTLYQWELSHNSEESVFIEVSTRKSQLFARDTLTSLAFNKQTTRLSAAFFDLSLSPGKTVEIPPQQKVILKLIGRRSAPCHLSNGLLFTDPDDSEILIQTLRPGEDSPSRETVLRIPQNFWMPGTMIVAGKRVKAPPPGGKIVEIPRCH